MPNDNHEKCIFLFTLEIQSTFLKDGWKKFTQIEERNNKDKNLDAEKLSNNVSFESFNQILL